jgi:predicted enzyme related to lactoylglutathione lyase
MKSNAIGWFEIYVQDMERARKFYEAVLGRKLEKLEAGGLEMWSFAGDMESYGAGGALVHMPGFPSGGNSTLVYFTCEDCANEEGRIARSGGKVEKAKFSIGQYGFVSLVYDTEGNMFGLHSMK